MNELELQTSVEAFLKRLFSGHPIETRQNVSTQPGSCLVRVGVKSKTATAAGLKAVTQTPGAMRQAWVQTWPTNAPGLIDPASIVESAEEGWLLLDLQFFLTLEPS